MLNKNFVIVFSFILMAVLSRLLPHPPNFTPMLSIALFGGAFLRPKFLSVLIPFIAMLVSDFLISLGSGYSFFHNTLFFVYGSMILVALIGWWVAKNPSWNRILVSVLGSSLLFFVLTNFGSFITGTYYSKDITGFISCYTLALPFFKNELIGNLFYSAIMFGSYAWVLSKSIVEKKA